MPHAPQINILPVRARTRRIAFTLVEILVVLGIIILLIGIVSFSLVRAKERAKDTAVLSAARTVATDYVIPQTGNFDLSHRWGANYDSNYLNGKLEKLLENVPYDNIYTLRGLI
jgi:competence protein ComGC